MNLNTAQKEKREVKQQLTTEFLKNFIGKDLVIKKDDGGTGFLLLQGPIRNFSLQGNSLIFRFDWLAQNDGGNGNRTIKKTWTGTHRSNPTYSVDLTHSKVEIDQGNSRIQIKLYNGEETLTLSLHSPNLDVEAVKGIVRNNQTVFEDLEVGDSFILVPKEEGRLTAGQEVYKKIVPDIVGNATRRGVQTQNIPNTATVIKVLL